MDTSNSKPRRKAPIFLVALIFISVVAIGASVFFYLLYQNSRTEANEQQKIVQQVQKVIEVPSEAPVVVTVADKNKLTNRQLAEKVNDGDVLLIYSQAKRLVVYRPTSAKVVDMLTMQDQVDVQGTTPANTTQ